MYSSVVVGLGAGIEVLLILDVGSVELVEMGYVSRVYLSC